MPYHFTLRDKLSSSRSEFELSVKWPRECRQVSVIEINSRIVRRIAVSSFPHNQPAAQDARRRHKADPFSASPPVLLRCSVAPAAAPALFRVRKVRQQPTNHHRNFSGYLFCQSGSLSSSLTRRLNWKITRRRETPPARSVKIIGVLFVVHNHRPQNGGVLVLVFRVDLHGIPAGYRFYPGTLS